MTRVLIQTAPTFSAGTPTKVFDTRYVTGGSGRAYDVSPDGQRFLNDQGLGHRAGPQHGRRAELGGGAEGQAAGEVIRVPAD